MDPKWSQTAATSRVACSSSVMSARNTSASPEPALMARATSTACASSCGPLTAMAKPSSARRCAMALPSPRELPVTKATRFSRVAMHRSFVESLRRSSHGFAREDEPVARVAVLAPAQGRQGDCRHGEPGCRQVLADRVQPAGAVVHDERRTPDGVAGAHGEVEAEQGPVRARGDGRRRTDREGEEPPGPQRAVHPGEQRGPFGGQEMPEGSEADRQVEAPGEGQSPYVGPHPPGIRVCAARLREHAGAEVDTRDTSLAEGLEDLYARTGAAAHVEPAAERPERAQSVGGRVENAIGGAKGRVVELRREQVVAALDRGQRLRREFTQRRAFRREHRPRVTSPTPGRTLLGGAMGGAATRWSRRLPRSRSGPLSGLVDDADPGLRPPVQELALAAAEVTVEAVGDVVLDHNRSFTQVAVGVPIEDELLPQVALL